MEKQYIDQIQSKKETEGESASSELDSSQNQPSLAIFKLNVDCFHEIFDWLSQSDLLAVGRTCKRLRKVVGLFYELTYSTKVARGENDGIYISSLRSNVFSRYIRKISISGERSGAYRYVASNCTNSIKHFRAYGTLPDDGFECIQNILKRIEFLDMNECVIKGDFYENYLKYCPNVKTISVTRSDRIRDKAIIIGTGNNWLLQEYPKLEHFELTDLYELKMNELTTFFQRNPKIRTLSMDSRTLWENRHSIIEANLKLDTLAMDIYQSKIFNTNNQPISMVDSIYDLLTDLYKRGFYKKLNLYMIFVDQENIHKLCSLPALEMIYGDILRIDRYLPDVNAVAIWCGDEIANVEYLPGKLPNLERIAFSKINPINVMPFIRHSVHLKQIKIKRTVDDFVCLNLIEMNKERKKLPAARKMRIYVNEEMYLATKWALKTIDFSLIELKRGTSADWEELCARSIYFKSI